MNSDNNSHRNRRSGDDLSESKQAERIGINNKDETSKSENFENWNPDYIGLKDTLIRTEEKEELETFLKELSFPRLVGTKGEKRAVAIIEKWFKKIGFSLRKYHFWATHYWTDKFVRQSLAILLILAMGIALAATRNLDWTYGIMGVMGVAGIYIFKNLTRPDLPIVGTRYKTVNLRLDIPSLACRRFKEGRENNGSDGEDTAQYKENDISQDGNQSLTENAEDSGKENALSGNNEELPESYKRKQFIPRYRKKYLRFFDYYEDLLDLEEINDHGAIIFMAHHDSKSQPLRTYVRAILFTITSFAMLTTIICFITTSIMENYSNIPAKQNPIRIVGYITNIIAILSAIPLVFNKVENKSPGAMDNASGVVTVYRLAKYFSEHPLENFRVICIIHGSEEVSTLGSRYMAPIIQKEIGERPAFVFNFDMVGLKNSPVQFIEGSLMSREMPFLKKLAVETASKMYIPLSGFKFVIGAMTDGFIYSEAGFQAIDFVNKKASFFTHTVEDTPDKFDGIAALNLISLVIGMSLKIDHDKDLLPGVSQKRQTRFVKRRKNKEQ